MKDPKSAKGLEDLRDEIEQWVRALDHPVISEVDVELFDLTATEWRLSIPHGRLQLEVWNALRSVARRIEGVAYRDRDRLGLFVRKPSARETTTIEIRNLAAAPRPKRGEDRNRFLHQLLAALAAQYPGWKFERTSHQSDREFSFSARYARGLARRGTTAWGFVALSDDEPPQAADELLAFGIIWLDWLRGHSGRETVSGLKLFLPPGAVELNRARASALDHRSVHLEIIEHREGGRFFTAAPPEQNLRLDARLTPRLAGEQLIARHGDMLREIMGESFDHVTLVGDSSAKAVSVRVKGLEVVRVIGDLAPRILYGLEGSVREPRDGDWDALRDFVASVLERRKAGNPDSHDIFFAAQPERWLESLLVEDLSRLDPELAVAPVYPQVPAIARPGRGIIDILGVTHGGRLAVIELKLHEQISLPIQALDYWLCVKELNERREFREYGFFSGVPLSDETPLLYLVSPGLRFHSTTRRVLRYFAPSIEVRQVGIGADWRERLRILFRRDTRLEA